MHIIQTLSRLLTVDILYVNLYVSLSYLSHLILFRIMPNDFKRRYIMSPENYAQRVLENYWNGVFPVDPILLCNALGIKVQYDYNLDYSGFYKEETREIFISPHEPQHRQRFSIAHEIGHAVMKHGTSARDSFSYNQGNYITKEFQANEFAAELLMPYADVESSIQEELMIDSFDLANKFGVSMEAMHVRLRRLRYM